MAFKIWGTGDIVRDTETIPFTPADYDHVEGIAGDDLNNHISIRRNERNLFENTQELFNFLEKLARSTNNNTGIFKGSLEQAFSFDDTEDVVAVNIANTYETQNIIAIMPGGGLNDLGRTYFTINTPSGSGFYVWFDVDNLYTDPASAQSEETDLDVAVGTTGADLDVAGTGKYFDISSLGTDYRCWFDVDNGSAAPAAGGKTLVEIDVASGDANNQIASKIASTLNSEAEFSASNPTSTVARIVCDAGGTVNAVPTNGDLGALITVTVFISGDPIDGGVAGKSGIEANLITGDTINEIAAAIETAVDANVNFACSSLLATATIVNVVPGDVTNAADGTGIYATGFTIPAPTINGADNYKTYARLAPGIAFLNGLMLVSTPQLYTAERQLIKAFNLRVSDISGENVIINYNFTTDKYDAIIYKLDINDTLQTYTFNNSGPGYDTGFEMLMDIYSHPIFHNAMIAAIGTDLTKVVLEPIAEVTTTATRYWSLMNTGEIELRTSSGDFDIHDFDVNPLSPVTVNNHNDTRAFFQNFNDFDKNIYINVPDGWESPTDPTNTTETLNNDLTKQFDPTDNTSVDYTKITNKSCMISILRQHDGFNYSSTSANFGWVEGDVADLDPHGIPPSTSGGPEDVFFGNKDLVIQWGIGALDWARFSTVAQSITSAIPKVSNILFLPGIANDGDLYMVLDVNQLYRYSSALSNWIPVSDPHKQFWAQTGSMLGNAADDWTGLVGRRFIFSGVWWKTDGSNLQVFVNGIFQLLGIDYNLGGTGTADQNSITFTYDIVAADRVAVSISEGGDEFYPEKVNYIVGTADGVYTGSLTDFPVYWELVRDKVDVFVAGLLKRDSPFTEALTETTGTNNDRIIDSSASFTAANIGNWILVISATNTDNIWEIRRVASVPNGTTLVLDSILPQITTIGDSYQLFEDNDYFVDEYTDTIIFANNQTVSNFVEIKDRATIVGTLSLTNKGTSFPLNPVFGMRFFRTDLSGWYTYDGSAWSAD